jgi:hypothetical protein
MFSGSHLLSLLLQLEFKYMVPELDYFSSNTLVGARICQPRVGAGHFLMVRTNSESIDEAPH